MILLRIPYKKLLLLKYYMSVKILWRKIIFVEDKTKSLDQFIKCIGPMFV